MHEYPDFVRVPSWIMLDEVSFMRRIFILFAGHFSPCRAKNDLQKEKYHAAAGESYLLHKA